MGKNIPFWPMCHFGNTIASRDSVRAITARLINDSGQVIPSAPASPSELFSSSLQSLLPSIDQGTNATLGAAPPVSTAPKPLSSPSVTKKADPHPRVQTGTAPELAVAPAAVATAAWQFPIGIMIPGQASPSTQQQPATSAVQQEGDQITAMAAAPQQQGAQDANKSAAMTPNAPFPPVALFTASRSSQEGIAETTLSEVLPEDTNPAPAVKEQLIDGLTPPTTPATMTASPTATRIIENLLTQEKVPSAPTIEPAMRRSVPTSMTRKQIAPALRPSAPSASSLPAAESSAEQTGNADTSAAATNDQQSPPLVRAQSQTVRQLQAHTSDLHAPATALAPSGKSSPQTGVVQSASSPADTPATQLALPVAKSALGSVVPSPSPALSTHAFADPFASASALATATPAPIAGIGQPTSSQERGQTSDSRPASVTTFASAASTAEGPVLTGAALLHSLQRSEMQVHVNAAEFGRVSVHATYGRGGLAAQISVEATDLGSALHSTLSAHVPAMEQRLRDTSGLQLSVSVSTETDAGDGNRGQTQQQASAERRAPSSAFMPTPGQYAATPVLPGIEGGRLDIRI